MSEAPPSSKRKRTGESPEPAPDTTPVRSKIWMPYGDIILQAESTQFRVNRDVLAQQSSVFRDVFSVPQPPNEPTVEGCPIVLVSDSAKDWELLLEILYHPFLTPLSRPFDVVASMLRLGKKYDIVEAKNDALARIKFEFPPDLEAYESTTKQMVKIDYREGVFADLLNLFYECGIYSCVPVAGLNCVARHTLERILTGVKRNDGSCVTFPSATGVTLAIALERILFFQRESLSWLDGDAVIPHQSCRSRRSCIKEKMVINHMVTWGMRQRLHDVSYTVQVWDEAWSHTLCDVCEEAAKAHYDVSRRKGWKLLPTFFGLPDWKDLKDLE